MSKALKLTSRQVTALCKGASAAGHVPVIEIDGLIIRLLPEKLATVLPTTHGSGEPSALQKWKTERAARRSIPPELAEHYERIGFDPATMDDSEYPRLYKEAEDAWRASIPGMPLGKREIGALRQLLVHGVGVAVPEEQIKNCGPDTEERLIARGYMEAVPHPQFAGQIEKYVLTPEGEKAVGLLPSVGDIVAGADGDYV